MWSEVLDGERDGPQAVCPEEEQKQSVDPSPGDTQGWHPYNPKEYSFMPHLRIFRPSLRSSAFTLAFRHPRSPLTRVLLC